MALSKVDYNSLNVTAAASKALKWNSAADGFETGDVAGALVLLATETASSSDLVTFDSDIDSTYPTYKFVFINMHPATNDVLFQVNFRDGSTAYDATKTTSFFRAINNEGGTDALLQYQAASDLAEATGAQRLLGGGLGNGNDESISGELWLYNPSSTTFVKHFMARTATYDQNDYILDCYIAGYCNTTSAIDGVQFSMSSGNTDSGTIKMYGVT